VVESLKFQSESVEQSIIDKLESLGFEPTLSEEGEICLAREYNIEEFDDRWAAEQRGVLPSHEASLVTVTLYPNGEFCLYNSIEKYELFYEAHKINSFEGADLLLACEIIGEK